MSHANPHFVHPERAPYELAHLLKALPANFHMVPVNAEQQQMLKAASAHASNYNDAVLHGIGAIGHLLFSAATNKEFTVEQGVIADIGVLLYALSSQAQFCQEIESTITSQLTKGGGLS